MAIINDEFLMADKVAERLGVTRKTILQLAREKHLTKLRDRTYPWPTVKWEFQRYQQKKEKSGHPTIAQKRAVQNIIENVEQNSESVPESNPTINQEAPITPADDFDSQMDQRRKDIRNLSTGEQIVEGLKRQIDGTEHAALQWSRALNESIKARQSLLELLEMESKTLKREEVETWLYTISKQNRDQWMTWPQRVATEMAEELGIDSRLMNDILMKHIRSQLERNATMPMSFGNSSSPLDGD